MLQTARFLIIIGLVALAAGGLLFLVAKLNLPIGHLPGDIRIQIGNSTVFFPLATSILLSVVLTLLLNLAVRLWRK